ncbi:MAG TPA: glycosyltransferase family 1 protein [Xanthobacteraceae bacterium]|jgi:glycosyltransferase involved in cell wall biosynthesis|nr:glycosyltransferase family 1 protein [Xanthobacteraceae bacterium]
MQPGNRPRILFDISTSMRWVGPPVGIVRVERQLALWAHANLPQVEFVFFDPSLLAYREVSAHVDQFLSGEAALDTFGLTNPAAPGKRRTDRIPGGLRSAFLWIGQTRRMALARLERLRLTTPHRSIADMADRLQRRFMSRKYRDIMVRPDGTRRPFLPREMALGAPIRFDRSDTLVCAGSGWGLTNIDALAGAKAAAGFRLVLLCFDLIPLLFPQFYRDRDVALFERYMKKALALADPVIVTSDAVAADVRAYCQQHGIVAGSVVRTALGFDVGKAGARPAAPLPPGLRHGKFAMLVSTIEPRKGHRLLYRIWQRFIAEGVVQATGFKLVFVGRRGWLVDELIAALRNDQQLAGHILILDEADDDLLAALYEGTAFCLYPSVYEGYGLPVVEAFSHGKAVLASTGGSLPELVQDFCPCLDPTDEEAWYKTIRDWIEHPQMLAPYEREIRARFRHPTWSEAAADFFGKIPAAPMA